MRPPRTQLPPIVLSGVPADKVGTLAGRVVERRLALKLTHAALAKKAGVSETSIRDLESQRTKSHRELLRIADALEVGPHWLMYGGPTRPVSSATLILAKPAGQALMRAQSAAQAQDPNLPLDEPGEH
jgi:transcriptional regulator with XRE-family HTH domain